MPELHVRIDRLSDELQRLARITDAPPPAVTRVLYSPRDVESRGFLKALCAEVGLTVREDAIGNLFARWIGSEPHLPAVATGSHTDAIPHAGLYDGCVGVLGGLEAIRALQASGFRPRRSIELILFTSEEPTRFGIGCVGSRALAGRLTPADLRALTDSEGTDLETLRQAAGFSGPLESVKLSPGVYDAFVELHIEQGPILERENLPIGLVTAIAAPAALRVHLEGSGGHAGAVLMPVRRDALCAAAEIVLAVEKAAHDTGSPDTVATVGICKVHPGAINSVPSAVTLEIDIRDVLQTPRDAAVNAVRSAIEETCARRKIVPTISMLNSDPPATMAPRLLAAAEATCQEHGFAALRMVSRAYHDSLFMALVADTTMIFIPCRNGWSHRPDEYSSPEAIAAGVTVLAGTLAKLAC